MTLPTPCLQRGRRPKWGRISAAGMRWGRAAQPTTGLSLATLNDKGRQRLRQARESKLDHLDVLIARGTSYGFLGRPAWARPNATGPYADLGFRGAGDENRTRTISLGITPIGARCHVTRGAA